MGCTVPGRWTSKVESESLRGNGNNKDYTESRIAIAEVIVASSAESGALMDGEYVATCAKQRCGYLLCIERLYLCDDIKLKSYAVRASPVPAVELAYAPDIEQLFKRGGGLLQVMNKAVVKAKGRKCNPKIPWNGPVTALLSSEGLISISPEEARLSKANLLEDLACGVSEARFWAIFVQCLVCKEVVLRDTMAISHHCNDRRRAAEGRAHPYLRRGRPTAFQAHLESIPGDIPEDFQLFSLCPSSPAPTEVEHDTIGDVSTEELA
ncbi:hypothetical protein NMY22_g18961 [Coprinellus aureogranulatus]|nr:hypothetical protein NMY22_g18961 [Coprinellus aureogranulatus]